MRIFEEKPVETIAICPNCGTKFAYDPVKDDDVIYMRYNGEYCMCPNPKCKEEVLLTEHQPMQFPDVYYHFGDGIKITNEQIRQYTLEGIKFLEQNPNEPYYLTARGDTFIIIARLSDGDDEEDMYYDVYVCKDYWNAQVEKKEAKEIAW